MKTMLTAGLQRAKYPGIKVQFCHHQSSSDEPSEPPRKKRKNSTLYCELHVVDIKFS